MHQMLKCEPPTEPLDISSLEPYSPDSNSPYTPTVSSAGLGVFYKLPVSPPTMASTPVSNESWHAASAPMNPPTTMGCGSDAFFTHDIRSALNVTVTDYSNYSPYDNGAGFSHAYSSGHVPSVPTYHVSQPEMMPSPVMSHAVSIASRSMSPEDYKPGMSYNNTPAATPDSRVWYPSTFAQSPDLLRPNPHGSHDVYQTMRAPSSPIIKMEGPIKIAPARSKGLRRKMVYAVEPQMRADPELEAKARLMEEKCKLTRTRRINDPSDPSKPQCNICFQRFSRKHNLEQHMRSHQEKEERPFNCSECPLKFKRAADLDRHWKSRHSNSRPHTCELCQQSFPRMDTLRRHYEKSCKMNLQAGGAKRKQRKQRGRQDRPDESPDLSRATAQLPLPHFQPENIYLHSR